MSKSTSPRRYLGPQSVA